MCLKQTLASVESKELYLSRPTEVFTKGGLQAPISQWHQKRRSSAKYLHHRSVKMARSKSKFLLKIMENHGKKNRSFQQKWSGSCQLAIEIAARARFRQHLRCSFEISSEIALSRTVHYLELCFARLHGHRKVPYANLVNTFICIYVYLYIVCFLEVSPAECTDCLLLHCQKQTMLNSKFATRLGKWINWKPQGSTREHCTGAAVLHIALEIPARAC